MSDIDAQRLVRALRKLFPEDRRNTMIHGEVKSIDPLKIDIGNSVVLTEEFLVLGQMCRPHKVTIPHTHLVNALMSEKTKSIITTGISAGVSTDVQQKTGKYDVKTQEITRNEEKGTNKRKLKIETKSNVDLGGAKLAMKIDIATSPVSTSGGAGTVSQTVDLSTFTPTDNGHQHIIPEHSTQDVHFPNTDYEDSMEIEIYPRLAVGDIVLMFAFNNFQMYYVVERVFTADEK